MITLIRQHYTGDFRLESRRQGAVVILSAAPQNNEELEEYLYREFFGTPVVRRSLPRFASQIPASTTAPPHELRGPDGLAEERPREERRHHGLDGEVCGRGKGRCANTRTR